MIGGCCAQIAIGMARLTSARAEKISFFMNGSGRGIEAF
jgi:hypothetical protein